MPSYTLLPNLLKQMKILLYAGDQDFMCNALGINRSINALEWEDQTGWGVDGLGHQVNSSDYIVNGKRVGSWTEARGLSFVMFDKAVSLKILRRNRPPIENLTLHTTYLSSLI